MFNLADLVFLLKVILEVDLIVIHFNQGNCHLIIIYFCRVTDNLFLKLGLRVQRVSCYL